MLQINILFDLVLVPLTLVVQLLNELRNLLGVLLQFDVELSYLQLRVLVCLVGHGPHLMLVLDFVLLKLSLHSLVQLQEAALNYFLNQILQLAEGSLIGSHGRVDQFLDVFLLQGNVGENGLQRGDHVLEVVPLTQVDID